MEEVGIFVAAQREQSDKDGNIPKQQPLEFVECDLNRSTFTDCDLSGIAIKRCNLEGATIDGLLITDLLKRRLEGSPLADRAGRDPLTPRPGGRLEECVKADGAIGKVAAPLIR